MEVIKIVVDKIPEDCSDCIFYENKCVLNSMQEIDECILEMEGED